MAAMQKRSIHSAVGEALTIVGVVLVFLFIVGAVVHTARQQVALPPHEVFCHCHGWHECSCSSQP
jgi:hypothetical protein